MKMVVKIPPMKNAFRKSLENLDCAASGLVEIWKERLRFRIEVFFALIAVALGYLLQIGPFKGLALILTIVFVLAVEFVYAAMEELGRKFRPESESVNKAREFAAAAVLISIFGALIMGMMIFIPSLLL